MNKSTASKILVFMALTAVCAYTVWFGTIKDPIDYTLSRIGNYFDLRVDFIIWGAITGLVLTGCIAHIYKMAGCRDILPERFLIISYAFLILTVLLPDIKETMRLLFYLHIASAVLFAISLLVSVIFFMRHLYMNKRSLYKKSLKVLIFCVAAPIFLLAAYGKLTGMAEIAFFVGISAFFVSVNLSIAKEKKILSKNGLNAA